MNSFKLFGKGFHGKMSRGISQLPGSTILPIRPYISGMYGIWFEKFPKGLLEAFGLQKHKREVQIMLANICTGVTPPTKTVNKITHDAMGGKKWSSLGGVENGTSFSLKFYELYDIPIMELFDTWVKLMGGEISGIGPIGGSQKDYSIPMAYWTLATDRKTVQSYFVFDGVFPAKSPMDSYSSSIESLDKLDIDIEFNVNKVYTNSWAKDVCINRNAQSYESGELSLYEIARLIGFNENVKLKKKKKAPKKSFLQKAEDFVTFM